MKYFAPLAFGVVLAFGSVAPQPSEARSVTTFSFSVGAPVWGHAAPAYGTVYQPYPYYSYPQYYSPRYYVPYPVYRERIYYPNRSKHWRGPPPRYPYYDRGRHHYRR